MLFKGKVDRAMRLQKERNEAAELKKPTEAEKDEVSKKDVLAMTLSALLLILLFIAFVPYFLFFH